MLDGLTDADIRRVLSETKTIAMIGASPRPDRASNGVMAYLLRRGYRVYPINPGHAGEQIHGQTVYARLADVPAPVDLVDIFRASDAAGAVVDEAIAQKDRLGLKTVWMQLGVVNEAAASAARAAGLTAVMDRCPKIEIPRLGL